jgi:hypothetical protein
VLPNTGHALNLEEPDLFNRCCDDFFHQVEAGRWPRRDPRTVVGSIMGELRVAYRVPALAPLRRGILPGLGHRSDKAVAQIFDFDPVHNEVNQRLKVGEIVFLPFAKVMRLVIAEPRRSHCDALNPGIGYSFGDALTKQFPTNGIRVGFVFGDKIVFDKKLDRLSITWPAYLK